MNVHDIVELSGLSRAQIDILISRHGYTPQGQVVGRSRQFTPADAFTLKLIAVLLEHGFSNDDAVRVTSFPLLQDSSAQPAEFYPQRAQREADGGPVFFITSPDGKQHEFVNGAALTRRFGKRLSWLVVDAAAIARQVEAYA